MLIPAVASAFRDGREAELADTPLKGGGGQGAEGLGKGHIQSFFEVSCVSGRRFRLFYRFRFAVRDKSGQYANYPFWRKNGVFAPVVPLPKFFFMQKKS